MLVDGQAVTVGTNWTERFAGGAWQPLRGEDVVVFLQVGTDYIPVDAERVPGLVSADGAGRGGLARG